MSNDNRANLLTIDDSMLRSMMTNSTMQEVLPCLAPAATALATVTKGRGCNTCESTKKAAIDSALTQARRCVANARGSTLRELKKLLNAKQIRILAKGPNGNTIKWTL